MYLKYLNSFKTKINKTIFRTPGIEFLRQNKSLNKKFKYLDFWFNRCKKNQGFKYFFFDEQSEPHNGYIYNSTINYEITSKMFESLAFYGILIIKNALPKNELLKIKNYFKDLEKLKNNDCWLSKPTKIKGRVETELNVVKANITHLTYLKDYSDKASLKIYNKKVEPNVDLHYLKIINDKEKAIRGETYLHSDRFVPHFKMFYTPYAISEKDAPFEYALQSHKINKAYLDFFKNSIFFDESDVLSKKLYKKKIKVITEPNTLYIAFTNGLHRRTDFKDKSERYMMFFQYVERFNKLNYLFSK